MKNIYISHFVLDVPTEKKELCPSQYLKLREELAKDHTDFVNVLFLLIDAKWYAKFRLWVWWHTKVLPRYFGTWLGKCQVWIFERIFKKDIYVENVFGEYWEKEIIKICHFLTDKKPCEIPPMSRLGWFQQITGFGFEHTTTQQFIEAHRCYLMLDKMPTEDTKMDILNELISYLFAPRIMWYCGTLGRLFFLKEKFQNVRKAKVSRLTENQKLLLLEYYVDNLRILREWYVNFYKSTAEKKDELDIYTQYFSMKSLIQLRSENNTLSDRIKMLEIRELIESYEVEIVQANLKKEAIK